MGTRLDTAIRHWLAAERDSRERDVEGALGVMFRALPAVSPRTGFTERVLAGVGLGRPGLGRPVAVFPWWGRAAIAACLLLAGLTLVYALPMALSVLGLVAPAEAAAALVQGFVALAGRLDEAVSLWHFFAGLAETSMLIVTAPPVLLTLLTLTVLSAFTLRGLSELVSARRSPGCYAQAH